MSTKFSHRPARTSYKSLRSWVYEVGGGALDRVPSAKLDGISDERGPADDPALDFLFEPERPGQGDHEEDAAEEEHFGVTRLRMIGESLQFFLKRGKYYSISTGKGLVFFQIVAFIEKSMKFVRTAKHKARVCPVLVSRLEVWNLKDNDALEHEVFNLGEPELEDASVLASWQTLQQMLEWKASASDAAGCIHLQDPTQVFTELQPEALLRSDAPLLSILDAMRQTGWIPGRGSGPHQPNDGSNIFSTAAVRSRRPYYQCLLCLGDWFNAGCSSVPRTGPQSYFRLMLEAPSAGARNSIPIGLSSSAYEAELKAVLAGDEFGLQLVAGPVDVPRRADADLDICDGSAIVAAPRKVASARGGRRQPASGRASGSRPPAEPLADAPPAEPLADAPPASSSSGSSSSSSSGSSASDHCEVDDEDIAHDPVAQWPAMIEGQRCAIDTHAPAGQILYSRLQVECPVHSQCRRYRSTGPRQCEAGPLGPVAYLACWLLRASALSEADHKAYKPSLSDMREWIQEQ
mmetsp:Transcript_133864/g.427999  ORF Transcript_133864/g.427999 Transcript_133864/m.427999 type:complete len:519 (-) Transcript_133864:127-1683(-)